MNDELIENNLALASLMANRYMNTVNGDFEEAKSIAYLGLVKAANTFDSSKGFKFSTYACRVMANEFLMLTRKRKVKELSLDTFVNESISELRYTDWLISVDSDHDKYVELCTIVEDILSGIRSSKSRNILLCWLYNPGYKQTEIAEMYGVSHQYVNKLISGFRQKVRNRYCM